jgi:hypothetical protein
MKNILGIYQFLQYKIWPMPLFLSVHKPLNACFKFLYLHNSIAMVSLKTLHTLVGIRTRVFFSSGGSDDHSAR